MPEYLGSRATFILGKFGGHAGRVLRAGDVLRWRDADAAAAAARRPLPDDAASRATRTSGRSACSTVRTARPTSSPTTTSTTLFAASWKVHYNSDRTGVRLIGPRPEWARKDGGEAGLHPSNIHDNAYAIGAMDFTGDMPILLGPDGPSLGGFVCPAVIAQAELWKMGQLRAGDTVRFRLITNAQATRMERELDAAIATLERRAAAAARASVPRAGGAAAQRRAPSTARPAIATCWSRSGPTSSISTCAFRVHALEQLLREQRLPGIVDITPGIRSLQIHYDSRVLPREELIAALDACERALPDLDDITIPTRIVHLPLSWDDPATLLAIREVHAVGAADAPWCPSNIEFIRRINGLDSIDDVQRDRLRRELSGARPRRRLPRRAGRDAGRSAASAGDHEIQPGAHLDAENSVGIGGAYLCVYGMEGPGGYQFVGRTVQMWNTHRTTRGVRARVAVAAALLRPDPLLSGVGGGAARDARRVPAREVSASTIEPTDVQPARLPRVPRVDRRRGARVQAAPAGGVRRRARALGRGRAAGVRRAGRRPAAAADGRHARGLRGRALADDGQRVAGRGRAGPARGGGAADPGARSDEDGSGDRRAAAKASSNWCTAPRAAMVTAGQNLATLRVTRC